MKRHESIETQWEYATYDVWGNAKDGYEVNDVYRKREPLTLRARVSLNNPNTPRQFRSARLTDKTIRSVFGIRCQIDTDGDDINYYVNRRRDGYPIGELRCVSHESLSPIKAIQKE